MYAVLQLEAEEKEMQQSEAQVRVCGHRLPWLLSDSCSARPPGRDCCRSATGVLVPSPQINTAKRLLSKGKETADQEPERSWFQTKEERNKEKSKS